VHFSKKKLVNIFDVSSPLTIAQDLRFIKI